MKGAEKKGELQDAIQEAERHQSREKIEILQKAQQRKREKLENEQLLNLLTDSLRKIPLSNHIDQDGNL